MKVIPTIDSQKSRYSQNAAKNGVAFKMKLTKGAQGCINANMDRFSTETKTLLKTLKAQKNGCIMDMSMTLPEPNKLCFFPLRFKIKVKKGDIILKESNIPARDKTFRKFLGKMTEDSFAETVRLVRKHYDDILKANKAK